MEQRTGYSDQELLVLLGRGNKKAFHLIYQRYWDKLIYLSGRKLHDLQEAESIVQDVFMDIWIRREVLNIQSSLGGYLVIAVKYRILNLLAAKARLKQYQHAVALQSQQTNSTGYEELYFRDTRSWLTKLVEKLPEKCRLAYTLRSEGFSHRQIAHKMQVTEKTVENHIGRALKSLRGEFGNLMLVLVCFATPIYAGA